MTQITETWICDICGLPCRLQVVRDDTDLPNFEWKPFACPVKQDTPNWKRDNENQ
jgi:hypothetical protein